MLSGEQPEWINPAVSDGAPLLEVIKSFKPTCLLGLSTAAGLFNEEVIRLMASQCDKPIILPMSNPTSKAECTAEQAYKWSDGKTLVAALFYPFIFCPFLLTLKSLQKTLILVEFMVGYIFEH